MAHSYNSVFQVQDNGVYTAVTKIVDFEKSGGGVTMSPAHYLDVPNAHKIYEAGLIDGDEVTLTLRWSKTEYDRFLGYKYARAEKNCKIIDPDGSTETFPALFQNVDKTNPDDGPIAIKVKLKINGKSTFTPAA